MNTLRYVHRTHNGKYHSFRYPGAPRVRLNGAPGSAEYVDHYNQLLMIAEQRGEGVIPFRNARRSVGRPVKSTNEIPLAKRPLFLKGSIGWAIDELLVSNWFRSGRRESTRASHRSALKQIVADFGTYPIIDWTKRNVDHYCSEIAVEHGGARADQIRRMISLLWEFAKGLPAAKIDEDRANPAVGGDKHYERKKHLAWPREVQRQFLEGNNKCREPANDREQGAFLMARHCGFRRGDIRLRKWTDLRKTKDGLTLSVKETEKNKKSVNMPVDDELADWLAKAPRDSEYILTNTLGEPYKSRSLTRLIGDRLKKLGIKGYCLHGLRHTFGSEMAQAGVKPQHIQQAMTHSTIKQAMEYCEGVDQDAMVLEARELVRRHRRKAA